MTAIKSTVLQPLVCEYLQLAIINKKSPCEVQGSPLLLGDPLGFPLESLPW